MVVLVSLGLVIELSAGYLEDELTARVQESNLERARAVRDQTVRLLQSAALRSSYLLGLGQVDSEREWKRPGNEDLLLLGSDGTTKAARIVWGQQTLSTEQKLQITESIGEKLRSMPADRVSLRSINIAEKKAVLLSFGAPANRFAILDAAATLKGTDTGPAAWVLVDERGELLIGDVARLGGPADISGYAPVRVMREKPVDNMQLRFKHGGVNYLGAYAADRGAGLAAVVLLTEEMAFEPVSRLRRLGRLLLIIMGSIALLLAMLLAWGISQPLSRLARAAERVQHGEYSVRLDQAGADEIGTLNRAFVAMAEGIARNEATIRHQALHDPLTDLPNRALLKANLPGLIGMARRRKQKLAIFYLDLDRFKSINDSLGHDAGDQTLTQVGERLRKAVYDSDTVVRMGGDEFTVLAGDLNANRHAMIVADKILAAFAEPFNVRGQELRVGASLGVALYPDDGEETTELLRRADMAMYESKRRGGNSYSFYTGAMNTQAARRLRLETLLHDAVRNQEFELHFQPRVSLSDGRVTGMEALARWTHAELGPVSPAEFIPLAEETGQIVALGDWILTEACRLASKIRDELPGVSVAINISPRQIRLPDLPERIARALAQHSLPASAIEIEITEGALVDDIKRASEVLQQIRELGVTVAIDDFGTGYSSLAYLKNLPVDVLKIDRAFVRGIPDDARDIAILGSIITLAKGLGLRTIAEGAETKEQADFLRSAGCDDVQGFYFFKPMPAAQLSSALHESRSGQARA